MQIDDVVTKASGERLYNHVLTVEGIRHPLESPERLEQTAAYILSEFERYGLSTNKQEFSVEGFDATFYNVEGIIGEGTKPELLITSHYDTVDRAPGADDNGSAIAVMLETARVLAEAEWQGNARFISFTLEEGNPARAAQMKELATKLGLKDEKGRITSWRTTKLLKQFTKTWRQMAGIKPSEAIAKTRSQLRDQLSSNELEYLKGLEQLYEDVTVTSWPGQTSLMGSGFWVDEAVRTGKQVLGVLNLEMVGYAPKTEHSQRYPKGIPEDLFRVYGTDKSLTIGDFLAIVGDQNSAKLAASFCLQCQRDSVNLPYTCLQGEFSFNQIAHFMRDLLRSDHAPFWRAEIPALMLTDTAEFRNPYYHTPADKINTLDFDFMLKVCKATIATTIDLASSD